MPFILIAAMLILLVVMTIMKLNALENRYKQISVSLNHMRKHLNIPEHPINHTLRQLIAEGNGVRAIKIAREALGLTLIEGKEYVDQLKEKKYDLN